MDWTTNIIKAEHPSHELPVLRAILAEQGDIVTFLPCKVTRQCFVRYSTSQGAESAYNNQNLVQGLRVSTVSQDPTLLNQYLTLHSSKFLEDYANKWCVPKEEQKSLPAPRKRAYSEVEMHNAEDSIPETKKEETTRRGFATDRRVALAPMTSERAQTKTLARVKGKSRAEGSISSYLRPQSGTVPSKENSRRYLTVSPLRAGTRQSKVRSPYSPKTKVSRSKGPVRAEISTPTSYRRKLHPKPGHCNSSDTDRPISLNATTKQRTCVDSSKQLIGASSYSPKTGETLRGEMQQAKALSPLSYRKPKSKMGRHEFNSDQPAPSKETPERVMTAKTCSILSKTATLAPVVSNRERSKKQPEMLHENTCETSIVAVPSSFSIETKIELKVAGEKLTYDLRKLEDDPKAIIDLLKLASAERGHWMIVAAFYRRRGNAQAATKLMTELLEVLKRNDVHENDMKPVYLMLSGCEADLAKTKRGTITDSSVASRHHLNAQMWLQKVYGTFNDDRNKIDVQPGKLAQEDGEREVASSSPRKLVDRIENHAKRSYDVNKRRKYYY